MSKTASQLMSEISKLPGGYVYSGACSYQVCFPLKSGGELRIMVTDDDPEVSVDIYDGALPPGISGFANKTGEADNA
jgi:hypothetical protein